MQIFSKKKSKNKKNFIKFGTCTMDDNWQRLGRITSENFKTFLALTSAKIRLHHKKNKTQHEFIFRKNSQISIQNSNLIFRNQDVEKLIIQSLN